MKNGQQMFLNLIFLGGKCYLSPTMDMYNNEIIGYDLSLNPNFDRVKKFFTKNVT